MTIREENKMRYFMHVHKTVSYAVLQINKAIATHLRGGKKSGAFRVRGMTVYPSGFGWYRIYGELSSKGSDLLSTVNFLAVRIKNMALRKIEQVEPKLFAFEEGFLNPAILKATRVLKVQYQTIRGHRVPCVINRAVQASEGFREFLSESLNRLHSRTVSDNKLVALQAKFAH
jgi:hypothetical protein